MTFWTSLNDDAEPHTAVHAGIQFSGCLCTCDESQALDSHEISVFDGHHASGCKHLLGVVIDQLPEEEEHVSHDRSHTSHDPHTQVT